MSVSLAGWTFLLVVGLYLPYLSLRGAARARAAAREPTRAQHLVSVLISQALLLFLGVWTARHEWIELFPRPSPGARDALAALLFLVPALGTLPLRARWKPIEERRRNAWMFPRTARDLGWWALVSLLAGTIEEIAYRGTMLELCQRLLGSWWAAVALCAAAFAVVHAPQGWRAVLVIAVLAVGSHWIVRVTGDLYTAMAVHVVYDLGAGLLLLRLYRREVAPAAAA